MKRLLSLILVAVTMTCGAQEDKTNFKELFMEALMSPTRKSRTEVRGPVLDYIRTQIHAPNARIVAEVEAIQDLPDGCKRLEMLMTAPGTDLPTKDGSKVPLRFGTILNLCPNGQPPGNIEGSSADANAITKQTVTTSRKSPSRTGR